MMSICNRFHAMLRTPGLLLSPAVSAAALAMFLSACQKSDTDNAPMEIRGQPINSATTTTSAAVPSATDSRGLAALVSSAPTAARSEKENAYASVGFDKLSAYNFELTDELLAPATNNLAAAAAKTDAQIPSTVKAFDQKRVAVKGFMLPLKVEGGAVTELLIMKDQSMCCYGATPKINEWISVKMKGAGVKPIMDQTVTLFGTLHVGGMRENGYLVGIYSMDGEKMEEPAEN